MLTTKHVSCDLCIVGGGISGVVAAIAAAREGLKVVLMHERPVLGGNASSEIRMCISGVGGDSNRETGVLEEIELENMYRNPTKSYAIWDTVLYDMVRREKNIQMLLNCTCMDADVETGNFAHGRTIRIKSVKGYQMTTQRFIEVEAKLFSDCSGDSILAPLTGAEFRVGREAASEFGEITSAETADLKTMGMSCLIQSAETHRPVSFIPPTWSAKLTDKHFENRWPNIHSDGQNFWYLELGGNRDSIGDTEELRDELIDLAVGTWDYIKNSGKMDAENWDLSFLGFQPGKRESRRMMGEYLITQCDISDGKVYEDEVAFGGWPLDDHFPDGFYHRGHPNTNYSTPAPYSIPYRALYSKNVDNLFFAGRNISVTHMAMSSTRVMGTCALLGQAVGSAAAVAVKNGCTPHDVYCNNMDQLQQILLNADAFLPSKVRKVSDVCRNAVLTGGTDALRNGQDRANKVYGTTEDIYCKVKPGTEIGYSFEETEVSSVHIVFSSDLNRDTLDGRPIERKRGTVFQRQLDYPTYHLPTCLCKEFKLVGELNGEKTEILNVTDNHKRFYHINLNQKFDKLTLIPISTWGGDEASVISFDFV